MHSHRGYLFQSPLHRGRLFNAGESNQAAGQIALSVPSSSGKTLQRKYGFGGILKLNVFQSPLHRGRLFNKYHIAAHLAEVTPFSPLFIGEDSSTATICPYAVITCNFQSPLHRGRLFNDWESDHGPIVFHIFQSPLHRGRLFNLLAVRVAPRVIQTFSPLFIGEDSSTLADAETRCRAVPFSPLFIGEVSSTAQSGADTW